MLERKNIFPDVIEMNFQAGHVIGCCVYLIHSNDEWCLVDIGYDDSVDEIVELVRQMDFPLSRCKTVLATHADVDHVQGLARVKRMLRTTVSAHPLAAQLLSRGDKLRTFAEIQAQEIDLDMPVVDVEHQLSDGDVIQIGDRSLQVWCTPGHCDSHLSFRMDDLLFSADNIYRDGCVGAIDAHHGSDIQAFIESLTRIRDSGVRWLLPSHGPVFRNDRRLLDDTIQRLRGYLKMADFGTCAAQWPLMDEWEQEIVVGKISPGTPKRRPG